MDEIQERQMAGVLDSSAWRAARGLLSEVLAVLLRCLANLESRKQSPLGGPDFLRYQTMRCLIPWWVDLCLEYKLKPIGEA